MKVLNLLKKTILSICCCALFCAAGGHLVFVQAFAWAKMTYSFAQGGSLRVAVKKTFDGKHPCQICKKLCRLKVNPPELKSASFDGKLKFTKVMRPKKTDRQNQDGIIISGFIEKYQTRLYSSPLRRPPRLA